MKRRLSETYYTRSLRVEDRVGAMEHERAW